jgi:hypothetical protein
MLLVAIALLKKGMASSDPVLRQLMFSLIKVWSVSGKTQQEFCLEKGLNFGDFGYWFRKYEQVYALPLSIPVSTCEAEGLQAS